MIGGMTEKIKLPGGPDKTATWIWLEDSQLKVEYYDFSEPAQRLFGNNIAYILTVHDMDKMLLTLNQNEITILPWMEQYFKSYFGIKEWLQKNSIEFSVDGEGWA